jgi:hypothetical protein
MPAAHGWVFCDVAFEGQVPMQHRRKFMLALVSSVAAIGFVASVVFADELLGVITKVDVEGKKLTVLEKDTDKEHTIKVTDDTETTKKGGETAKLDLEKLEAKVKKTQEKGSKGVEAKIWHEKNVASKIQFKGKGAGKKKEN